MAIVRSNPAVPSSAARKILRRTVILQGATLIGGGALIAATGVEAGSAKSSQQLAGYQSSPKGSAQCDKCLQFQPPAACKLVDGQISPSGWCNFFAPR